MVNTRSSPGRGQRRSCQAVGGGVKKTPELQAALQRLVAEHQTKQAKQSELNHALDKRISTAKRGILQSRRMAAKAAGKEVAHGALPPAIRGDVTRFAKENNITPDQLRVSLRNPYSMKARQQRGRPPKVTKAQEHFVKVAVEDRADNDSSVSQEALGGMLGAVAASNQTAYSSSGGAAAVPSKQKVKQFIKRRGLIVASACETENARIESVSRSTIIGSLNKFKKLQEKNPMLRERRRVGNLDETPDGNRGEKLNRRIYAITTKKVLKKKGFAQTRTAAIADGNYPMSYCPFQLADSTIVAELFIVATDNTNFATWLKKPPTGVKSMHHEYLPGIALDFFDRQNIGIYASPGGVMTTEIFEKAIRDVIVPSWRRLDGLAEGPLCIVCDAPESHAMSVSLMEFLRDNDICMHYLPHHTSHYLQPLDLGWNKAWRRAFRAVVDALITVAQNTHAYLDDKLNARFHA